jgi:hypothetical protein
MLWPVALIRTDVSEERIAYNIRVTRIGELGTTLAVRSNVVSSSLILVTPMMEKLCSSKTSALTIASPRNIPEDGIPYVTAVKASNLIFLRKYERIACPYFLF